MSALLVRFYPFTWVTSANYFAVVYAILNVFIVSNPDNAFTSLRAYLPLIWASSVSFVLLCFASHYVSLLKCVAYENLSPLYRQHWNMRVMSSIHAILVSILAAIALGNPALRTDLLETWSPLVGVAVSIFLGYCALDTWMTLAYHDEAISGGLAIIIHHIMVFIIALYPLNSHRFGMITACYLLNEVSTPFMNNIHFMRDMEVSKSSMVAAANSVAFLLTFFIFRVCMNVYVMVRLLAPDSAGWTYPGWLFLSGGAFVILFLALNLYWFYKILKHALALVLRKERPAEQRYEVVSVSGLEEPIAPEIELSSDNEGLIADYLDRFEMA